MTAAILSAEDRRRLLSHAREAIARHLEGRRLAKGLLGGALDEPAGAFVTLSRRSNGDLRGCVGYVEPMFPLSETVARAAVAAAVNDTRFDAVTRDELPSLMIEISALEPPRSVKPDEIEVGRHGLIVSRHSRRGLLLPQVPVEHGWSRETFLNETCRKAGLPKDSWRQPDTQLLGFGADVFGEE